MHVLNFVETLLFFFGFTLFSFAGALFISSFIEKGKGNDKNG